MEVIYKKQAVVINKGTTMQLFRRTTKKKVIPTARNKVVLMTVSVGILCLALLIPTVIYFVTSHNAGANAEQVYNNNGISDDKNPGMANYDSVGFSYSAQALMAKGIIPGAKITFRGSNFIWPNTQPGQNNNYGADGQPLGISLAKGSKTLGFLGSSTFGPVQGTVTITYTDGTKQTSPFHFDDWTLNGGRTPSQGNFVVAAMNYRNGSHGRQNIKTYLFYTSVNVQANKTVASVMLPNKVNRGQMHIFAMSAMMGTTTTPASTAVMQPTPVMTQVAQPTQVVNGGGTANAGNKIAWSAFDGGGQRSGVNTAETTITTANVGQLKQLWQQTLPATVDGAPVELPNVMTAAGTKDLVFVTTKAGSLLAIDGATGNQLWRKDTTGPNFTTSSPAIDPSGKFVYGYGLDGKVHKYAVSNGDETLNGTWPVLITNMPNVEKGSSPLNIVNGMLYMPIAGYPGDGGHYEGHVVGVNLATGVQTDFNALCSNIQHVLGPNDCADVQSAIWARGAAEVDPLTGNVIVATGNGAFRADGKSYGDSVVVLSADLTKVLDSYTPANFAQLQATDQDLGSAVPAILPKQANSSTPYMMVQAGKDNNLRLLNRQNLSGQGGPNHTGGELQTIPLPQKGDVDTHPAVWTDGNGTTWVFVVNFNGQSAFKVVTDNQGHTTLQLAYQNANAGSSPFIANSILYVQGNGVIWATNPTTGAVLWSSSQPSAGGSIGGLHWQSPIIVNGTIFAVDNNGKMYAYGLK